MFSKPKIAPAAIALIISPVVLSTHQLKNMGEAVNAPVSQKECKVPDPNLCRCQQDDETGDRERHYPEDPWTSFVCVVRHDGDGNIDDGSPDAS